MYVVLLLLAPLGVLVAVLLVVLFLVNFPSHQRKLKLTRNFPHPSPMLPLLGHILLPYLTKANIFHIGRQLFDTYGSRYMLNLILMVSVNICDAEAAEAVLTSSKNIEKSFVYDFLKPWLCEGLLTSSGARWHARRKLLTPAFHFRILGQFSSLLEQQAQGLVNSLEETIAAKGAGKVINIVPAIARATLRSIQATAMGDIKAEIPEGDESYFQAVHRVGKVVVYRFTRPWLWFRLGLMFLSNLGITFYKDLRTLHVFTEKVIQERKRTILETAESKPKTDPHDDFFQFLLDKLEKVGRALKSKRAVRPFLDVLLSVQRETGALSDRDIREEVDTFMFEGHDTTAMAICWSLEVLGRHPAEQDLLAAELLAAESDWESISRLPYLDRVFKECLRLRPSVPFIARLMAEDAQLKNGDVIPAGSTVHIHIFDLHRNPEHFPNPDRFDPERFLPEEEQKRHPFAYIPFSAGPRNCIGKKFAQMEVKLFIAAVVRNFVIHSTMSQTADAIADLVLRPREGIFVQLRRRIQ